MSEARSAGQPIGAERQGSAGWLRRADWLSLAATPVFGLLALLTWTHSGDTTHLLCSTTYEMSSLGGMVPMYVLMSIFHSTAWFKLVSK